MRQLLKYNCCIVWNCAQKDVNSCTEDCQALLWAAIFSLLEGSYTGLLANWECLFRSCVEADILIFTVVPLFAVRNWNDSAGSVCHGFAVVSHACLRVEQWHFKSMSWIRVLLSGCFMHARKGIVGSRTEEHLKWCFVCDSAKIFLTCMFSYLLLSNPTHKTINGTANR